MRSPLQALWSLPSARAALALAALLGLAMCAVPVLAVHGPQSALVLGLLLPPLAGLVSARLSLSLGTRAGRPGTASVLEAAVAFGLLLVAAPSVVLGLDALRVRNCSPGAGLLFMLLGPSCSVVLASVCGVACACWLPRPRLATALAALLPLGSLGHALASLYGSPAIFAYGHFFGWFPGTIYDDRVAITAPLLSLRVVTLTWALAIAGACTARRGDRPAVLVSALGVALGLAAELYAPELGHGSSAAHLRETLGAELTSRRCRIVHPTELPMPDRRRLAMECDFRVERAERFLGVTHGAPVSVFVFRSAGEKRALIGAAETNLAKPWRSELYLNDEAWPNPVLAHELLHVVARAVGNGPLRLSSRWLGLLPNPALIEGVAVAGAWQAQGGLTPHEWARALLELGMAPRVSELVGLRFLAQPKRMAYTLSGSLVRFVAERFGSAALRRAYQAGSLTAGVALTAAELEARWHAFLRAQPLSPAARELARARFQERTLFSSICPSAVAELREELSAALLAGDDVRARARCERILDIDPADSATRATLAGALARLRDDRRALSALRELSARAAPRPLLAAAKSALADEHLRRGEHARAGALYSQLLTLPSDDDGKRLLQVKVLAASAAPAQRELLAALLLPAPGERADAATALHLARLLEPLRDDGLPEYLQARQLFGQKRFALAAPLLDDALRLGLPSPELSVEALRLRAISAFATGQRALARRLLQRYAQDGRPAHVAEAADWLARLR